MKNAQQAGLFYARKRNRDCAVVDSVREPAWGTFAFPANPSNLATITIGGTVLTFVTGAPSGAQAHIGATLGATLANAVAYFDANPLTAATVDLSGDSALLVQSKAPADTTVTLAASAATVSHATLQKNKVRARRNMNSLTVTP